MWWSRSFIKHPGVTVGRVDDAKPRSLAGTPPPGVHPCQTVRPPARTPQSSWQPLWSQGTKLFVVKFLRCLVQLDDKAARAGKSQSAMNPNVGSHPVKILLHISWSFIYCLFRTYMHISTSTNLWDFCSVTWDTSKKNWSARTNSSSASSCATTSFHPEVELSTAATSFRKILRWKCKSERMWSFCKTSHKVKWIDPVIYWYKIYQNM